MKLRTNTGKKNFALNSFLRGLLRKEVVCVVKFGLRIKGHESLLKYKVLEIKGLDGTTQIFELDQVGINDWLLESLEAVNNVLSEKTYWYNTNFERPRILYAINDLEIVKVDQVAQIQEMVDTKYLDDDVFTILEKLEDNEESLDSNYEKSQSDKTIELKESPEVIVEEKATYKKGEKVFAENQKSDFKVKVKCDKSIPKEMGSVRYESDPIYNCFVSGKTYLAYIKNQKLYMMNEDKIPEFICNATEESNWEENFFFKSHFSVLEYIEQKNT